MDGVCEGGVEPRSCHLGYEIDQKYVTMEKNDELVKIGIHVPSNIILGKLDEGLEGEKEKPRKHSKQTSTSVSSRGRYVEMIHLLNER